MLMRSITPIPLTVSIPIASFHAYHQLNYNQAYESTKDRTLHMLGECISHCSFTQFGCLFSDLQLLLGILTCGPLTFLQRSLVFPNTHHNLSLMCNVFNTHHSCNTFRGTSFLFRCDFLNFVL